MATSNHDSYDNTDDSRVHDDDMGNSDPAAADPAAADPGGGDIDDTRHMEYDQADITVPLATKQPWQPGPKLTARVTPARPQPGPGRRRDQRLIAAAILITAAAVAVALWITALWLRSADDPIDDAETAVPVTDPGDTEAWFASRSPISARRLSRLPGQSDVTVITLHYMNGGLQGGFSA